MKSFRKEILQHKFFSLGRCLRGIIVLLCSLFIFSFSNAQEVIATIKADSSRIVIGDHLNVRLALRFPKQLKLSLPAVVDTLGNMDVVSAGKTDTVSNGNDIVLARVYTVSAFDSGEFHAGPVMIPFTNAQGQPDTTLSNFAPVLVTTVAVDTTKPFKAIKAPLDVPYSWKEFIPYIIGAIVLLILIVIGVWLYIKYSKEKPKQVTRPVPKDPAHIWARKELKKLEDEKLWQKDEVKLYYSRLTEILRLYLEFRYKWFALESTTEEIEVEIEQYKIKDKAKEDLFSILRTADLVKFAKMLPAPDANIQAMEKANRFIDWTEPKDEIKK